MRERVAFAVGTVCMAIALASPLENAIASSQDPDASQVLQLQALASELSASLDMKHPIQIVVVPENKLVTSVEPMEGTDGGYRVVIERGFLDSLSESERTAAIAHELGHVWLFTHHPFLHTEVLANEIAMRVVSREMMESLYLKLWKYTGAPPNLASVLGPRPERPERSVEGTH